MALAPADQLKALQTQLSIYQSRYSEDHPDVVRTKRDIESIRERFGLHPVSGNSDRDRSPEELIAFRDELLRGVRMKGALTRHLYAKERWDFFAQVFTESHCAGHLLWHLPLLLIEERC